MEYMEIIKIITGILLVIIPLFLDRKFRELANVLFLEAEKIYTNNNGFLKFDYVIQKIYIKLPILKIILPKKFLKKYVQYLFDTIKDLLDDGKINKTK